VIVVDNGSTDQTAQIASNLGATVITEPQRGYGAACLAGLNEIQRWVTEEDATVRVVAFVDADYSDHVDLLEALIEPIFDDRFDFVLGSRLLGEREKGAMPPQSVYGNKLATGLMNRFFGGCYTDLGPMRAIDYASLMRINMVDENFGWTIEMQLKALRHGLRVVERPVPYRRRIGTSKISGTISGTVRAGSKILYSLWRYGWSPQRDH
jgi:glycosyltransferase involved in cell wall biosynthesis